MTFKNVTGIVQLMCFIEIGILKSKTKSYRTKKGLYRFLSNTLAQFLNDLCWDESIIEKTQILNYLHGDSEFSGINDFGYSCNNKCKPSDVYDVFRTFGVTFYKLKIGNKNWRNDFKTLSFGFKGCRIEVCISGMSEPQVHAYKDKITYIGESYIE